MTGGSSFGRKPNLASFIPGEWANLNLGEEISMRSSYARSSFTALAIVAVVLTVSMIFGNSNGLSINSINSSVAAAVQSTGITLPRTNIYVLNSDNTIFVLTPGMASFARPIRVSQVSGNLIGIDFRPADASGTILYGLTDTGNVYTINLAPPNFGVATLVSTLTTPFAGGFQSLMDFNPVVNALRVIGSNDQNFALVNSSGNLNVTAAQTAMTYAPGDVNAGVDPNLSGGSYTNNIPNAPNTLFYGIDYALDSFVTIATVNATGSSNTGGGQLKTIGRLVGTNGTPINFSPTADIDIYTDANGVNTLVGVNGRMLFTLDLAQINPSQALGTTQNVIVRPILMDELRNSIDIAISPVGAAIGPNPRVPGGIFGKARGVIGSGR